MTRPLAAAVVTLGLLGGCAQIELPRGRTVEVGGDVLPSSRMSSPMTVEVENARGSVFVRANPIVGGPTVSIFAPRLGADENPPAWISAATSIESGGAVLRVLAAQPGLRGGEAPANVDVYVTVPSLGAVRVRNAFGDVEVVGPQGTIDVANGLSAEAGGNVSVRTSSALRGPVDIRTRTGDINLRVGRGSAGGLDIRGERGASVAAPAGAVTDASADARQFQGRLGRLGEPFVLRALQGRARVSVER